MVEQAETSSDAADVRGHRLVWVCAYGHGDGIDTWVCRTEDIAYRELAAVCRECWDEAQEVEGSFVVPHAAGGALPAEPPSEDRAAVALYFAVMNDADPPETFVVAAHEITGAPGGGSPIGDPKSDEPPTGGLRIGRIAEARAIEHLGSLGYRLLERDARTGHGELDLVAFDPRRRALVFVEVETVRAPGEGGDRKSVV